MIQSLKMVSRTSKDLFLKVTKSISACMLDIVQYSGTITESAEVGNQVLRVMATDADSGSFGEIMYMILMGNEVI